MNERGHGGPESYSVTVERGTDGTYLAWVDDLPGCAIRARSSAELHDLLPDAIAEFRVWADGVHAPPPRVTISEEVESAIEADEDTEVLVAVDRGPLTDADWARMRRLLTRSRAELLELLGRLTDEELDSTRAGSERSVREEIEHIGFVELMYALWTFDLRSREGLAEFLAWTREVADARLQHLAGRGAADLTAADWAGAPRPESWTPRKAARRLVWHELLHLRAIERFADPPADSS